MKFQKQLLIFFLDIVIIYLSVQFATFFTAPTSRNILEYYTGPFVFTVTLTTLIFYIFSLYDLQRLTRFGETIIRVGTGVFISNFMLAALFYILGHWTFPKRIFLYQSLASFVGFTSLRVFITLFFPSIYKEKVFVIGAGDAGKQIGKVLKDNIVGYIDDDEKKWCNDERCLVLGPTSKLIEILEKHNVKKVILAIAHNKCSEALMDILLKARLKGVIIVEMINEYEELTARIPVHHIHDHWIIMEQGFKLYSHELVTRVKRLVDIVLSIIGLLVLFIPMLLTAIIVRLESKGPVIFKQKRVGLNEEEFTIYKFRSMCNDAEKNGAVWAQKGDARVTRFGRFIRKVRLDELPQLWNILKGDMSLIGPRPERMVFVKELKKELPYYYLRHTVKPGLTGWAQIMYPYGATVEDAMHKLEYDLYYIKNMSLTLDLKIILKTIGVMLFGQGAR